ncbi:hypothetical protein H6P81_017605 [Aristolochia fimbriata]|uniref:Uncharacterized protein n=1 Tax=Aristolochia fimbriata TaxID=158543 RepID=A0AAV7E1Q8_ARIFI|nr:hypothetical protein H6P81_017605 [Aristolochia fimbriata]
MYDVTLEVFMRLCIYDDALCIMHYDYAFMCDERACEAKLGEAREGGHGGEAGGEIQKIRRVQEIPSPQRRVGGAGQNEAEGEAECDAQCDEDARMEAEMMIMMQNDARADAECMNKIQNDTECDTEYTECAMMLNVTECEQNDARINVTSSGVIAGPWQPTDSVTQPDHASPADDEIKTYQTMLYYCHATAYY